MYVEYCYVGENEVWLLVSVIKVLVLAAYIGLEIGYTHCSFVVFFSSCKILRDNKTQALPLLQSKIIDPSSR
jgi:hypothetical protein